ncbi:MAG: ABC transporter substrate-binding protein [Alphaproteobacteria bacterium]|nr:ABC transporter substrate-binding protein [Alphaproteobacteria bacterium]
MRLCALILLYLLAACGVSPPPVSESGRPQRIVSLDYCADQYVLRMVEPERILAVSRDAHMPFSYMREAAAGLPVVRASAESVLALKPDLVVRSYGGGPNAARLFEQAGVPTVQVGWAGDLDGIRRVTREMATALGAEATGEEIVADFDRRLAAIRARTGQPSSLYMTPGGVTSGPGSLVHEMLVAAGLANFVTTPGWQDLPLEHLVREQPDHVAYASFNSHKTPWSRARHPVARAQLDTLPVTRMEGAWTSCGAWFLIDAIEQLAQEAS